MSNYNFKRPRSINNVFLMQRCISFRPERDAHVEARPCFAMGRTCGQQSPPKHRSAGGFQYLTPFWVCATSVCCCGGKKSVVNAAPCHVRAFLQDQSDGGKASAATSHAMESLSVP